MNAFLVEIFKEEKSPEALTRQVVEMAASETGVANSKMHDYIYDSIIGRRFPEENDFACSDECLEYYSMFDFVTCCFKANPSLLQIENTILALYSTSTTLFGICQLQSPDSAEFGIASSCVALIAAANLSTDLRQPITEQFLAELQQMCNSNRDRLWHPSWVAAALRAAQSKLMPKTGAVAGALTEISKQWELSRGSPSIKALVESGEKEAVKVLFGNL